MSNQIILTEEGKLKLEAEVKELKEVRRPDIISKIEQAKELGDLSENAEYHDAKDQQGLMEARISEIEGILKKAVISQVSDSKTEIGLGCKFIVENADGDRRELTLVGFNEAEPLVGKISNESPMGVAFQDKKPGETVEVEAPKGIITYKVIEIL
ncbi:transcription elongation factor GreA [Candidatus Kuenenbacteria bacterium]|nr:transcription elongation factor GreA [Candidatus Kuenenbacteria bacterium]